MKKQLTTILAITICAAVLAACGWKPEVTAVPLTQPWTTMNLPVKDNAVVWKSDPNEFRAVHKEDKRTILKSYTDALKGQGWQLGDFNESGDRFEVDMKKGSEPLRLEVYDFDNTGVVIKTGAEIDANPYYPSNTTKSSTSSGDTKSADSKTDGTAPPTSNAKVEKADFTVTSEEFDKEFTKKGAKKEDLEKYASKNIAVTGRVSTLVLEKQGTVQPWVTLYAPGVLRGVNCYFDDADVEQMKRLKMDKMVKVQGFKDSFIVPEVSPTLDHCQVLEAN